MWKPIETAPKDGSLFIGMRGQLVFSCRYREHYIWVSNGNGGHTPDPDKFNLVCNAETFGALIPWSPTYWMPLPPPPEST